MGRTEYVAPKTCRENFTRDVSLISAILLRLGLPAFKTNCGRCSLYHLHTACSVCNFEEENTAHARSTSYGGCLQASRNAVMFQLSLVASPRPPKFPPVAEVVELQYTNRVTLCSRAATSSAFKAPAIVAVMTWVGSGAKVMADAQWTTPAQPRTARSKAPRGTMSGTITVV